MSSNQANPSSEPPSQPVNKCRQASRKRMLMKVQTEDNQQQSPALSTPSTPRSISEASQSISEASQPTSGVSQPTSGASSSPPREMTVEQLRNAMISASPTLNPLPLPPPPASHTPELPLTHPRLRRITSRHELAREH